MRLRSKLYAMSALAAAAGLATIGCPTTTKCSALPCPSQQTCDPLDGLCKCGSGSQGIICAANEYCDASSQTCLVDHCRTTTCSGGNVCDPQDGICKCSGKICPSDQPCDVTAHLCATQPACDGVICTNALTCDPTDGKCRCYGVDCAPGTICDPDAGSCQPDPCYGVHCAGADEGIQCILGVCRCGKADGTVSVDDPVCSRIQHCQDGQCTTIVGCESVPPCQSYELCSPLDLKCHCGSRNGPICSPANPCVELGPDGGEFFTCQTENDCHQIVCPNGQICDPNQGFNCACETAAGLGGMPCQQNEYCIALDATKPPVCTLSCNVYIQQQCQVGDAGPLNCYAEIGAGAAVCEVHDPMSVGAEGDPCGINADCGPGLGCWTHAPVVNNDAGVIISTCALYCDVVTLSMQNSMYPCTPPRFCTPVAQVQGSGGQTLQIGFCQ